MTEREARKSTNKHVKTQSLRDLMLGKKTVKELPENFFEKVLELEIKLKKGFSMDVLTELVSYYKVYFNNPGSYRILQQYRRSKVKRLSDVFKNFAKSARNSQKYE